jgi:hypothetical protein
LNEEGALSEAEFAEFDRYMKIADRAGAKLRREKSEAELRALAQETGQRWLACLAALGPEAVREKLKRLSARIAATNSVDVTPLFRLLPPDR